MGILRADLLTHSQLESAGGSVVFDGSGDYLTIPNHSAFHFTGDYTIDFYIKFSTFSGTQRIFGQRNSNASDLSVLGEFASNNFYYYYSQNGTNSENIIIGSSGSSDETKNLELNTWYHVAIVSDGGVHHSFLNGVQTAVNANNPPPLNDGDSTWSIGRQGAFTSNEFSGSIYGFRITQGALYKDNFTVSKFKPKVLPGTVLLCCVSSTSVTEAEVSVAGDITSNGDPQIGDTPLLKEDITDTGVVFDGFTVLATSTYMVPPSGKTTERNRGRGVIMGGVTHTPTPNSYMTQIDFLNIPTTGNSQFFGDLSFGSRDPAGAVSSTTRAIYAGGMGPASEVATNSMSFITIATTGNGTDYGDLTATKRQGEGCSNGVRGLFMGGENDSPSTNTHNNVIDFCTIATAGNALDFGDLTEKRDGGGVCSSPIRGVCGGGFHTGNSDVIDFVTIATTGNATDFGNLTAARTQATGCASATRGLFMGGRIAPNNKSEIDFITIASTGNASDFGDLSEGRNQASATASQTRGVQIGGNNGSSPNNSNTMEFVTIASTGNTTDFGDTYQARTRATTSDCHGGLS